MTALVRSFSLLLTGALIFLGTPRVSAQTTDSEPEQVVTLTPDDVGPYRPKHDPDLKQVRQLIVKQTNALRKSERQTDLERNKKLDAAAQQFARYMARTDRYSHRADGQGPDDRARLQEYDFCLIAENIAYHFATESFETQKLAQQAIKSWKDSPGHRRNMLNPHATEFGVGVAQSEATGIFYAVQLFGRPSSAEISFQISNAADQAVSYTVGKQRFDLPAGARRLHQLCIPQTIRMMTRAAENSEKSETETAGITPEDEGRYTIRIVDSQPTLSKGE